jgi:hypothetical protein
MRLSISWSTYLTGLTFLVTAYYAYVIWRYYRPGDNAPSEPVDTPLEKDEWMDHVLTELEATIAHADTKRYGPEELIKAVQHKMTELKQTPSKS